MRVRATVAYDGGAFSGFAVNDGVTTVAGVIEAALARRLGVATTIACAGRTDKGVHALGQVISFDVPDDVDLARLHRSLDALVGADIAVLELGATSSDFDARFSARWRRYRYEVSTRRFPDPFEARRAWAVREPLDLRAMRQGCAPFIGEHDFSSFCRRPKPSTPESPPVTLRRRVLDAEWSETPVGTLAFTITGAAFCHQMVRSVVGCLVAVGRGSLRAADVRAVMLAADRDVAPPIAPPHGLYLVEVGY